MEPEPKMFTINFLVIWYFRFPNIGIVDILPLSTGLNLLAYQLRKCNSSWHYPIVTKPEGSQ